MGGTVFALEKAGFDIYGVDFAPRTVELIRKNWPHLKIFLDDVRALSFENNVFEGYWSLGVIEHFYDGYQDILDEMARVVKPGGYVFVTFPAMNALRKNKAAQGEYPCFKEHAAVRERFYQFALEPAQVIANFEKLGFTLVKRMHQYSLVGLQKEREWFRPMAKFLTRLPLGLWVKLNMLCDPVIGNFSGHTCLLVLKNSKKTTEQRSCQ